MEQATTRDQSSDSIATSDEFEDLGHVNKNSVDEKPSENSTVENAELEKTIPKTSPEIEIGNNGNMNDLQETLNEVLDEENQTNRMEYLTNCSLSH